MHLDTSEILSHTDLLSIFVLDYRTHAAKKVREHAADKLVSGSRQWAYAGGGVAGCHAYSNNERVKSNTLLCTSSKDSVTSDES